MALALLEIFGTKGYCFTTHAMKQVLTQNECFLRAEKAENLSAWFSDCRTQSCRQIFEICQGSQVVTS